MRELRQLLEKIDYEIIQGELDKTITTLVYDSRKAEKDSLFVCVKGAMVDGHTFAKDVVQKGASVLVVEDAVEVPEEITVIRVEDTRVALAFLSAAYFDYPADTLKVIGITGTKGKTTTTYMVKSILENAGYKTGLIGTIEAIIGDEKIPAANTTPESYKVQEYFRKMLDAGCECAVMEVSSQGLMMHRVDGFTFDIGIFTNIEPDHIGPNEHASFEEYLECKAMLFQRCKLGIVNGDDAHVEDILKNHTCKVERYGFSQEVDIRATNVKLVNRPGYLGVSYQVAGLVNGPIEIPLQPSLSVTISM